MNIKSDIEIAQEHTPKKITEIAAAAGIDEKYLELYGNYKAKVDIQALKDLPRKSKLVLVTAISPTPAGEGKTTTSVGLADALNRLGKRTIVCLREPSLGPVFGVKGGAAGGGHAHPHGGHQPALHRRLPRHRHCEQPDGGADRQPHSSGQRAEH